MRLLDIENNDTNLQAWIEKGYILPKYNREIVKKNTLKNPEWIHFGAGNIFRAFLSSALQEILNENEYDKGVIVCEGFDYEIIDKAYKPYDNLSLLVLLKSDGNIDKRVVGSVVDSINVRNEDESIKKLQKIFQNPSLQIVSFTITEKGYSLLDSKGEFLDIVKADFENGPDGSKHTMCIITSLLYKRFITNKSPIALVSMDNCSHNGDKLKSAVINIAEVWCKTGFVSEEFINYINDKSKVSFPWSMIDKITPRPDNNVKNILEEDGFEDTNLIITSKNTYISPFVNAEETEYLVIEDSFPNGRPPLEKAGIIFTDRETVDKVEKMKVCTCLNPLHTALALFGCIKGYTLISEEMNDKLLRKLVYKMAYEEAMPVVINPKVISPESFLMDVLERRLPNPFMPDSPQRIATDTSQKLAIRFGVTLKEYERRKLDVSRLICIPLVIAGYLRYLMEIDDNGNYFELSSDPLLDEMKNVVKNIKLGDEEIDIAHIGELLKNENIFGVDLVRVGLSYKIISMFKDMIKGVGAVNNTLEKYLG